MRSAAGLFSNFALMRPHGPLAVLLLRFAALAGVHTLLRLAFWLFNRDHFPGAPFSAFAGGVRFDLTAIAWLNLPWVLLFLIAPRPARSWGLAQKSLYHIGNAAGFFINSVDIEYYTFTLKRSTSDLFSIASGGGDLQRLAPVFARDYWYIVVIFIACIVLAEFAWRWSGRSIGTAPDRPLWRWMWRIAAVALMALLWRGGSQLVPIGPLTATRYADAAYMPLVLNSAFTFLHSIGKPAVVERNYMPQEEADELWPVIQQVGDSAITGSRPNVVVIILESFSAAYSGKLSGGEGYMPFLDSLMGESLCFTQAYANGRRSVDGIPAILASMPELMNEAFIASRYAQIPYTSLQGLLKNEGYATSFYHGGHNGTMGFDAFARQSGFDRYVGFNEYPEPDDDDGTWGMLDRPFLQFFARELETERQPFMSCVFTLSSHHPYKLPAEVAGKFKSGTHRIHPSLQYSDDALRQFFATARKMPWFDRTLFVITADHTADLERDGQVIRNARDYWVPLLFYMPLRLRPTMNDHVVQHIDILPTVLELIGHRERFFSFGHDALGMSRPPIAVSASNGVYLAIINGSQIKFDGEKVLPPAALPPGSPDPLPYLKAAIQQFNGHLLRGELTVSPAP